MYADYVLTESGGFQMPDAQRARACRCWSAEKGTFWIEAHRARHPRARLAAVPHRQRAGHRGRGGAAHRRRTSPQTQIHEAWRQFVEGLRATIPRSPRRCSTPTSSRARSPRCRSAIARHWHACTHTTFAPTVAHGGTKTNVIPDRVDLEVDIRTLPGQTGADATAMLRDALGDLADAVEIESNDDPATASPIDTPLWDSLARDERRACAKGPRWCPSLMVGGTDNRFYRRAGAVGYGFGLFSQRLPYEDFAHDVPRQRRAVDQESLALSTQIWEAVARDLLDG